MQNWSWIPGPWLHLSSDWSVSSLRQWECWPLLHLFTDWSVSSLRQWECWPLLHLFSDWLVSSYPLRSRSADFQKAGLSPSPLDSYTPHSADRVSTQFAPREMMGDQRGMWLVRGHLDIFGPLSFPNVSSLDSHNGFIWRLWRFIGYLEKWDSRVSITIQEKKKIKELIANQIAAVHQSGWFTTRCLKIRQRQHEWLGLVTVGIARDHLSHCILCFFERQSPFAITAAHDKPTISETLLKWWLTARLLTVRATSSALSLKPCAFISGRDLPYWIMSMRNFSEGGKNSSAWNGGPDLLTD